jgi:hypothetical protein
MTRDEYRYGAEYIKARVSVWPPRRDLLERGGFVAVAELVDCFCADDPRSGDPWFQGPYGFLLHRARAIPFHPFTGKLGLFEVDPDLSAWLLESERAR